LPISLTVTIEKRQGPKPLAHSSVPAHPLDHRSPVQPDQEAPSCPGSWIAQTAPEVNLRVAPKLTSGSAERWLSELPRFTHPSAAPAANFRVAPNPSSGVAVHASSGFPASCIDARVDDESLPELEVSILSLRCGSIFSSSQIRPFLPCVECNLNLNLTLHCRTSRP